MSEKKEIEDIKSKNKILSNQLTYIKKPYGFAENLKNYDGKIDELHRFLFLNTSFKPSSFTVSMNIARGIIKKIPNHLDNKKIDKVLDKNNPDIYNNQNKIIKPLKNINYIEKQEQQELINELIQEINKSNQQTKTKISKIINKKGPKIFNETSEILNHLNKEYKKYFDQIKLTTNKKPKTKNISKKKINNQLNINETIEAAILILIGSIITLNNINKPQKNSLYSGLIITAFTFVKYPNLENKKHKKHEISINQTKLNDFQSKPKICKILYQKPIFLYIY